MGFDKLFQFISKNLNNECIEDINIESNIRKVIVNHVMFDINFLIYQALIELEEEINNIIKIILNLPFSLINENNIEDKLLQYFSKIYWKNNIYNLEKIFDGFNEDDIIVNFINYINEQQYNNQSILDNILMDKILYKLVDLIKDIHYTNVLETINIIFDGIPSYSKILEQRRRRIKNYLESQERKSKFDDYFKNIENTYQQFNGLTYDYFKWLKYRFTIDKSLGPSTTIIKKLEIYLLVKMKEIFPKFKININPSSDNGEADYKIFREIYNKNYIGDIVIHTIDSDLIHQIIVQQNYFNIIDKDINLSVIKYNYKNNNIIQLIDGKKINSNMLKVYNEVNNIQNSNYCIIYDLALIFYFFGNDHLPSSYEINSELNLDYLCRCHKNSLNNITIVKLIDNIISVDFNNLNLYLKEIKKNNELNKTKILLGKYFKINNQLIHFLTEKLKLNFENILELNKKLLFDSGKKAENLDEEDIRFKLIKKYENLDFPFNLSSLKNINKMELNANLDKLLNILDISDSEDNYCGLPLYSKPFYLIEDNYQNLYFNLIEIIVSNLIKRYPIIYDYVPIENQIKSMPLGHCRHSIADDLIEFNIDSYFKKIYHLVTTLFGNMENYNSNNLTFYGDYTVPNINLLCDFLDTNCDNNLVELWQNNILNDNISLEKYFNSINHHILITPFLKKILWKFKSNDFEYIINHFSSIDNLWWNNYDSDYNYKDIDINKFLNIWNELLIKIKLNKKVFNPEIIFNCNNQNILNYFE